MIKDGLLDEAMKIMEFKHYNALQTVGYKELFKYLDNNLSLDESIDEIKKNTRRFAKRQLTWFRSKNYVKWFDKPNLEELINYIEINQQST